MTDGYRDIYDEIEDAFCAEFDLYGWEVREYKEEEEDKRYDLCEWG